MKKNKGFTLLEMLVVFSIIGILLAFTTGALISARKTSRDAKRKTDLEQLRGAIELFKADNSAYPITTGNINPSLNALKGPLPAPVYIAKLPNDPDATRNYFYVSLLSGGGYALCAGLENSSSLVPNCGTRSCGTSVTCNYEVNNP